MLAVRCTSDLAPPISKCSYIIKLDSLFVHGFVLLRQTRFYKIVAQCRVSTTWMVEDNSEDKKQKEQVFDDLELQAMADAGVYYGRKKTKTHPAMRQFIYATRNNIEILDLEKTRAQLVKAKDFIREKAAGGALFLVIGTQPAARQATKEIATQHGLPYVVNRWLGGTLTNFKVISQRVEYLKKVRGDMASGELEKYTKKERAKFNRMFQRLEQLISGLEELRRIPDVIIVSNINEHKTAVREANRLNIPIVAIIGTSSDPGAVSFPIPANDAAKSSLTYLLTSLAGAIEEGKTQAKNMDEKPQKKEAIEEEKGDET